jgi:hypothetical protein
MRNQRRPWQGPRRRGTGRSAPTAGRRAGTANTACASTRLTREGSKKECHQDGPRSTKMRPAGREAVITPERLVHDRHHQGARDQHCRSTPDVHTKPLAEDKFRASRRQMYWARARTGRTPRGTMTPRQRIWMQGQISRERRDSSDWWSSGVNVISHTCRPCSEQHENRKWRAHTRPSTKKG